MSDKTKEPETFAQLGAQVFRSAAPAVSPAVGTRETMLEKALERIRDGGCKCKPGGEDVVGKCPASIARIALGETPGPAFDAAGWEGYGEYPRESAPVPQQPAQVQPEDGDDEAIRPTCDTPGCGRVIPVGGEGHPEICPTCLKADAARDRADQPSDTAGAAGEVELARVAAHRMANRDGSSCMPHRDGVNWTHGARCDDFFVFIEERDHQLSKRCIEMASQWPADDVAERIATEASDRALTDALRVAKETMDGMESPQEARGAAAVVVALRKTAIAAAPAPGLVPVAEVVRWLEYQGAYLKADIVRKGTWLRDLKRLDSTTKETTDGK